MLTSLDLKRSLYNIIQKIVQFGESRYSEMNTSEILETMKRTRRKRKRKTMEYNGTDD